MVLTVVVGVGCTVVGLLVGYLAGLKTHLRRLRARLERLGVEDLPPLTRDFVDVLCDGLELIRKRRTKPQDPRPEVAETAEQSGAMPTREEVRREAERLSREAHARDVRENPHTCHDARCEAYKRKKHACHDLDCKLREAK